jgi:SAM-dependent methyltransferase
VRAEGVRPEEVTRQDVADSNRAVACDLCGAATVAIGQGVVCGSCGFLRQDPLPTSDGAAALYAADPAWEQHDGRGREHEFERVLALIEQRMAPGHLLDVGCGLGGMLRVAAAGGWRPMGLDVNPRSVARVRQLGFDGATGGVADARGIYDAITYVDALGYVPNTLTELRAARERLRPGGVIAIKSANVAWHRRAARFRRDGFRFVGTPPESWIVGFTPRALREALDRTDYRDIAVVPSAARGMRRVIHGAGWPVSLLTGDPFTPSVVALGSR